MKEALSEVVRQFKNMEEITSQARRLLATLEVSQFAQLKMEAENSQLFPLPFSFLEKGYLLVEQQGKKAEGGEEKDFFEALFSLHLSLNGLGEVEVAFFQSHEGIRIRFQLNSSEKAEFVSGFADELKEAVSSHAVLGLTFTKGAEDPGTTLLKRISGEENAMFEVRI